MNFIAIDFETANEKRNSPCSVGIVVVKNSEVVEKIYYLIKPKEMIFRPINIGIHGIRPSMVENELEFDKVWMKIKDYFNNNLVIAHNAGFDISVLRRTLELYNIEQPEFNYICTMKLSRNFYNNIENAKLSTVNRFLEFEFKHHDALADALACSNILINISKELNTVDINEISRLVGVSIGSVNKDGYTPSSNKGRVHRTTNKINYRVKKDIGANLESNIFSNEVIVFTGGLSSLTREEAIRIVRRFGGTVGSSVTKKTTILVTNLSNIDSMRREEMSTKLRKAVDLKEKGQNIRIINEDEFLNN